MWRHQWQFRLVEGGFDQALILSYSTYFWSNCSDLAWPGPPKCSWGREIPLFHLGSWNIVIWQDCILSFGTSYCIHPQFAASWGEIWQLRHEKNYWRDYAREMEKARPKQPIQRKPLFFSSVYVNQSRYYESLVSNPCQKKGNWTSSFSKLSKRLQSNSQTFIFQNTKKSISFLTNCQRFESHERLGNSPSCVNFPGFQNRRFQEPSKSDHGRRGTICGMRRIRPGLDLLVWNRL